MSFPFSPDERHTLEQRLTLGQNECPRCGGRIDRKAVPQRPDVPYVRDRILVTCSACGATTVLDRRRVERGPQAP